MACFAEKKNEKKQKKTADHPEGQPAGINNMKENNVLGLLINHRPVEDVSTYFAITILCQSTDQKKYLSFEVLPFWHLTLSSKTY